MKKCIRCGNNKELKDFYVHPQMRDGHLNKCKVCCKEVSDLREKKLRENPEFCEKERVRSKERYHRLNYGKRQYVIDKSKPYKNGQYKNLSRKLKLSSEENSHHWNYNLIDDVTVLNKKFHRFVHRYLILDNKSLVFTTKDDKILDTKEKHLQYIEKIRMIYTN